MRSASGWRSPRGRGDAVGRLAIGAGAVALVACGGGANPNEDLVGGADAAAVLTTGQYLYLRCNSTDWNVSETSRLTSTARADVLQLAIHVTRSSTLDDQCIVTLVTADAPDTWGVARSNFTDASPAGAVLVPGGGALVGPQSAQTNFGVTYPGLGTYVATVDWSAKTFSIAAQSAGAGMADAALSDAATPPADAGADTSAGDVGARDDAGDSGPRDAAGDAAVDAPAEAATDTVAESRDASGARAATDATADGAAATTVDAVAVDPADAAVGATSDTAADAPVDGTPLDAAAPPPARDAGAGAPPDADADDDADDDDGSDGFAADDASSDSTFDDAPDATAQTPPDASSGGAPGDDGGVIADDDASDDGSSAEAPAFDAGAEAAAFTPDTGGYTVRGATLLDTSRAVAHLLSSADFYAAVADPDFGGYYTYLDQQGHPTSTDKASVVQSRDAYAFVRAFMVSGDPKYLDDARSALDFLYAHAWDAAHGGFTYLFDRQGNRLPNPSGVPSDKWSFTQHYGLVGITAMCEATLGSDCDWLSRGTDVLEQHFLDGAHGGYFTDANLDFTSLSDKGFTPTVDGITTHALYAFLLTQAPDRRARFLSLADDIDRHLVASMTAPGVVFGFPESYDSDWSIQTGNTYGFVGHLFKSAWCLARGYLVSADARYRDDARTLLMQMWNAGGFDRANGAPNFDFNWNSGVGSTDKEYWQIEQGFTAGITNWYIATSEADRAVFLEMADRSLDFFMTHLPDAQFGGIFFQTNADGTVLRRTDKGDQWEGAYHNVELSYYAYLYGNLLLWHRPVTLFYEFDPASQDRTVTLNPLAIEGEQLLVTAVRIGGAGYSDFDGRARTLHLPPGTGGTVSVTYEHTP